MYVAAILNVNRDRATVSHRTVHFFVVVDALSTHDLIHKNT